MADVKVVRVHTKEAGDAVYLAVVNAYTHAELIAAVAKRLTAAGQTLEDLSIRQIVSVTAPAVAYRLFREDVDRG